MNWLGIPLTLLAGAILAMQVGVNSALARNAGSALWASGVSFIVGSLVLVLCYLGFRLPWPGLEALRVTPAWAWCGGILGAVYVSTLIIMAPKLGATFALGLVIAGQLGGALLLDHFALFGYAQQSLTPGRLAGVLLIILGTVLIRRF